MTTSGVGPAGTWISATDVAQGAPQDLRKLTSLGLDYAPNLTPGTSEVTALTYVLAINELQTLDKLWLRATFEKLGGNADTLTVQMKINGAAFYSAAIATTEKRTSYDKPFKIETATTFRAMGHGSWATTFGGNNSAATTAAGTINNVATSINTITVTFTMGVGAGEYGNLVQFDLFKY